jgi:dihydroorotase
MVHFGDTPNPLAEILSEMRSGDILTHCFHGRKYGILDSHGEVRPEVKSAIQRGILFDVGHGLGSFSFEVAESALKQGVAPATISSDLHFYNVHGPVYDLATTMSKFMLLGLSMDEVLMKTTSIPAGHFGLSDRFGTLKEGSVADIAVFRLTQGNFEFEDCMKETRTGDRKLEPAAVIQGGRLYWSRLYIERGPARDYPIYSS